MAVSAWLSLLLLILVLWALPIGMYFYQPKDSREEDVGPEWEPMEYEQYKFKRGPEIAAVLSICIGFSWLIWLGITTGALIR